MLIDKNNLPLVDEDFMNNTHFEDVDLINKIYEDVLVYEKNNSNDNLQNLKKSYLSWINHTVNHFKTEEDEMQKRGFFAYPFHKGEHDKNLKEIKEVWEDFYQNKD